MLNEREWNRHWRLLGYKQKKTVNGWFWDETEKEEDSLARWMDEENCWRVGVLKPPEMNKKDILRGTSTVTAKPGVNKKDAAKQLSAGFGKLGGMNGIQMDASGVAGALCTPKGKSGGKGKAAKGKPRVQDDAEDDERRG